MVKFRQTGLSHIQHTRTKSVFILRPPEQQKSRAQSHTCHQPAQQPWVTLFAFFPSEYFLFKSEALWDSRCFPSVQCTVLAMVGLVSQPGPWGSAVRNQAERASRRGAAPLGLSKNLIAEGVCFNPKEQNTLVYCSTLNIPCYLRFLRWVKRHPILPQWGIWVLQMTLFLCPRGQAGGCVFMKSPWVWQLPLISQFAFRSKP